jgi:protein tyrosine phosphatase (PTP) superfamily phosphohydrolase (DUF442 family)
MGLFRAKATNALSARAAQPAWRRHRRIWVPILVISLLTAGGLWYMTGTNNFCVVGTGRIYRSAQLDRESLLRVIQERGIKSIMNLRGPGPEDWYNAETNATQRLGLKHIDFTLSAGEELTDVQMDELMAQIENAPKPMLIHCKNGSDRTGLAGALYLYKVEGQTAETAGRELSISHGHFPYLFWRDTIAMDRSFSRYVSNHSHPANSKTDDSLLKQSVPTVATDQ